MPILDGYVCDLKRACLGRQGGTRSTDVEIFYGKKKQAIMACFFLRIISQRNYLRVVGEQAFPTSDAET